MMADLMRKDDIDHNSRKSTAPEMQSSSDKVREEPESWRDYY